MARITDPIDVSTLSDHDLHERLIELKDVAHSIQYQLSRWSSGGLTEEMSTVEWKNKAEGALFHCIKARNELTAEITLRKLRPKKVDKAVAFQQAAYRLLSKDEIDQIYEKAKQMYPDLF